VGGVVVLLRVLRHASTLAPLTGGDALSVRGCVVLPDGGRTWPQLSAHR
jgi:hypothetical protein